MNPLTKEVLLKTDPGLKNRPYQLEALLSIFQYVKCLVKMFCGTGKSRIITNTIIHKKKELSVVVFPSLALIHQYSTDYLKHSDYKKYFNKHKMMNVSSEKLDDTEIKSTTDDAEIKTFLKPKGPKIILVTYQSYNVLLKCLGEEGKKIGLVCYDEAHHIVSPEYQKLVFGTDYYEDEVFFTATPRNENGITMFDLDNIEKNMCGPVAYDYSYLQGLKDEFLNQFDICGDMYTKNTNASVYEAIARAILTRGTSRVLSFHSGVNGESNTDVWNFVKQTEFQTAFNKVVENEFPDKKGYYTSITFKGMDGKTPPDERKALLASLDSTPEHEIYLISSCETIGEGVDTKKANMCVFADPKASITKIIQNIGRVVRRNSEHPLSTVLIPCWVNMDNYASAEGDPEKQDELIREQMRATNGDYAPILNVLGALRQDDPEIYEMCLNYPNRSVKEESLAEQGFRIVDEDEEDEYDEEDEDEDISEEVKVYSPDEVAEMKARGETPLEIHTNNTIERFNEDSEKEESRMMRLYHDEEEDVYKPIVRIDNEEIADTIIQPPNPKKRIGLTFHQNDEIQMLWRVQGDLDFSKTFCTVIIECEVSFGEEKWRNTSKKVCAYMDTEKKSPREKDENPDIKTLGYWVSNQKKNYKNKKYIVWTNTDIRHEWETILEKYGEYLYLNDNEEEWRNTLKQVCEYMDTEKKSPREKDKNPDIKKLGSWVSNQKKNYKNKKYIVWTNEDIRHEWETILETYSEYLINDNEEDWRNTLKQVCEYMDTKKKSPREKDENPDIKKLGKWVSHQKTNYKNKKRIVWTNEDIRHEWETILEKYAEYLSPKSRTKKQKALPLTTATVATTETATPHNFPPISDIGTLHKRYLKMRSDTLNQTFKADPQLWREYHATRKQTFATYVPASIPSNRIIQELEKIQTKRQKIVVDMGCGEAPIAHHFQNKHDSRFVFHNYDHQSGGDPLIQEVDISALPLDDADAEIVIMSLALWGTKENCIQYIKEAYRVLESGGKFYISDSTKKWSPENPTQENGGELLRTLLTENGFTIVTEDIGNPFCLFKCSKIY